MRRDVLPYARPVSPESHPIRGSLARWALVVAAAVAVGQASLLTLGLLDARVSLGPAFEPIAVIVSVLIVILWVIGLALSVASWIDRDGPRRTVAAAVALLGVELLLPFLVLLLAAD